MILRLTDGTTTLDLMDITNYGVPYNAWTPKVARRRRSQMGGNGPYENVIEEIPLHVRGASAAAALANLAALAEMLDQAERWSLGEDVAAVWLQYQPTNSTGDVVQAVVVGDAGDLPLVGLSPRVNDAANYEIEGITLYLERRGLWLAQSSANLVLNGSFEDFSGGAFDDWSATGVATVTQESSPVYDGTASAKIDTAAAAGLYQDLSIPSGFLCTVTAWVYVSSGEAALAAWDGTTFFNKVSDSTTSTGAWVQLTVSKKAVSTGLRVGVIGGTSGGVFFVDNLRVEIDFGLGDDGEYVQDTAVDNGDVASFTFPSGATALPAPTRVSIQDLKVGAYHLTGYIAVTNSATGITVVNADSLSTGGAWSAVADSTHYARNTNVLRYTPASTSEATKEVASTGTIRRLAVFANVRNNSTTTTFTIRVRVNRVDTIEYYRPVVIGPQASARPEWVYLGEVTATPPATIDFCVAADAASGSLDADTFVILDLDDNLTSVVAIHTGKGGIGNSAGDELVIDHRALTKPTPVVTIENGGDVSEWSAQGKRDVYTSGATITAIAMVTGDDTGQNAWRQAASSTLLANDWTVTRLPGSLIAP